MSANSPEPSLTIPDFDPEDLELADVFLSSGPRPTVIPGAPAMISAGLNSADLRYVYVNVDPPGEPVAASVWEDPRLTQSVWLDLRPAEALVLSERLRTCAEAAARFAEAYPEEPEEAFDGVRQETLGEEPSLPCEPPSRMDAHARELARAHVRRLVKWGKRKPFRRVIQIDGFNPGVDGGDGIITSDEGGYCVLGGIVEDPRATAKPDSIPVRVQVALGTDQQVALDLLDRMREWVARGCLGTIAAHAARAQAHPQPDARRSARPRPRGAGDQGSAHYPRQRRRLSRLGDQAEVRRGGQDHRGRGSPTRAGSVSRCGRPGRRKTAGPSLLEQAGGPSRSVDPGLPVAQPSTGDTP